MLRLSSPGRRWPRRKPLTVGEARYPVADVLRACLRQHLDIAGALDDDVGLRSCLAEVPAVERGPAAEYVAPEAAHHIGLAALADLFQDVGLVAAPGRQQRARSPIGPAEDAREYARRWRSLPVDQVLGDFLFSRLNAAQVKLGGRDSRLLIDVTAVALEHARPTYPGRTHQADRPGAGTAAAESGERGKPREPARPAGGERSEPGPAPPPTCAAQ